MGIFFHVLIPWLKKKPFKGCQKKETFASGNDMENSTIELMKWTIKEQIICDCRSLSGLISLHPLFYNFSLNWAFVGLFCAYG